MNGIVLCGPQGCGKTKNAKALMTLLGMKHLIDDFVPGNKIAQDTLHLTNHHINGALQYNDVIKNLVSP